MVLMQRSLKLVTLLLTVNFGLAFAYAHSYQETSTNSVNLFNYTGSVFANAPFSAVDTVANH
ncbi:MAG: hypothetical protein ACHBN1_34550 [Heteroscytonema crispum UTEX LB 1556]